MVLRKSWTVTKVINVLGTCIYPTTLLAKQKYCKLNKDFINLSQPQARQDPPSTSSGDSETFLHV